jgi:hypothetical protein
MTAKECEETAFEERFLDGPINVAEVEGGVWGVRGLRLDF